MKKRQLLILLIIVCNPAHVFCQLSIAELDKAIVNSECEDVAAELNQTPLLSEEMKFKAAICFYQNGKVEKAQAIFSEVRKLESKRQFFATYWEAKCQVVQGSDSLALVTLRSIPEKNIHHKMLSDKVFDGLAASNEEFTRLKKAVAPGFNAWTVLLTIVAVLGLMIGLVLFFGKSNFSAGEKRLSVLLFSFAFILLIYILHWTKYAIEFPYLMNLWQPLTLLIGPSLYFYLKEIFEEKYTAKQIFLHHIAAMVSGLFILPNILSGFGLDFNFSSDFFSIGTSPILLTTHLLFYAVLIHNLTYNEWQIDSNIKVWTKVVNWGMKIYTGAFISYFILVRCSFFNPEWDYSISMVMALGILSIAYMGLVQKRVFQSEPIGRFIPVKKYQTSSLTESASESIKKGMERLLKEEQVYKENELRLADLAAYLDVSYHQLSQVINEHYGVNFFELINRYRVEHVKRLLADSKYSHYTILQIAFEAGFNNKASFNRYFKKEIGMTPSAYRIKENSNQ